MEDVRRPATYTQYIRKQRTQDDDAPSYYSLISLVSGLIAVLFSYKILGWVSLFAGIASLTSYNIPSADTFNMWLTFGFSVMTLISTYMRAIYGSVTKKGI